MSNQQGMEELIAQLQGKVKVLAFTASKTDAVLAKDDVEVSERQRCSITKMIKAVIEAKEGIEELKFSEGETAEEIAEWGEATEQIVADADGKVRQLADHIKGSNSAAEAAERTEKWKAQLEYEQAQLRLQQEHEARERESQIKQEEQLLRQKLNYQQMLDEAHPDQLADKDGATAKLPKLTITKFNGTFSDWLRFWNQFESVIDKQNISGVMKFSYLKNLVEPKVLTSIDGLPFTEDGFTKAKEILLEKYGNTSEVVNAYVEEIIALPTISGAQPHKIHEFFEKLRYSVQSLETLEKLNSVNGYVRITLNKLPGIRGDLVRADPEWKQWSFVELVEALRKWTERNPVEATKQSDGGHWKHRDKPSKVFQTQQKKGQRRSNTCVYCDSADHKSSACLVVQAPEERKSMLAKKKLCFNCTGATHLAANCRSTATCQHCARRHHTSICEATKEAPTPEGFMTAHHAENNEVVYPVVQIEVDGIPTRALLDSGAGSSYASAKLVDALRKRPTEVKTKRIEMMLGSTTMKVEIYTANVASTDGRFSMSVDLTKVHKSELMTLDNPRYEALIKKYDHLQGVKMNESDCKPQLPVHVVLGASEYAAIKTRTSPRVGTPGQPVAEKTLLGWTLMSPGREEVSSKLLLTQSTSTDYQQLCALDVLGLEDTPENDQGVVYQEFKEQLVRDPAGWYESSLPWKGNHPPLPTNEIGSRRRLENLIKKVQRSGDYENYDAIIQEQLEQGVVEPAPQVANGKEFYIPHKGVTRQNAESTKLRIVYDASAREGANKPSLNDCLHPGPPLQNLLWSVLIRARFYPIAMAGDIQKAFLQIRIKEEERDSLRFHWRRPGHSETEVYRFTRALFGLTSSPFLLGGVISQHLARWEAQCPETVKEIRDGLYVDDLLTGGSTVEEVQAKKQTIIAVFEDATFKLHKWHSNAEELERNSDPPGGHDELSYAKQQLGTSSSETKLLGLPWNKKRDTLAVAFPRDAAEATKREVLSKVARIYDPLGLASPTTLTGKLIYRDICDSKVGWDSKLPGHLRKQWDKWWSELPAHITVERPLGPHRQPIQEIALHAFGDASTHGVCTAVYAVVKQEQGTTQRLVCAKSRLAKRNLTIPRLELVASHMAVNLATNVRAVLDTVPVAVHCWSDSTVALYWIHGQGEYRQFVANRVRKINQHENVQWHHVPTADNPADLGSRGGSVVNAEKWHKGPTWLSDPSQWPPDKTLEASAESKAEAKITREIFATAMPVHDSLDQLLDKYELWKVLRVGAWMRRFIQNSKLAAGNRESGPLTTAETEAQIKWWIKRAQRDARNNAHFEEDQLHLNLQLNDQRVLECRGRLEGEYPIYLPDDHPFTRKLVHQAHLTTLHGGVGLTMAKVRTLYWVPRLRRLVKKVRGSCWGCKRFRIQAFQSPPPGHLPSTRTQGDAPYQVIGVDFAGPIRYRSRQKTESKAYLVLYACSLTRGVFLDLVKSLETEEFIASLKRFIARRGRPGLIYSDNGSTFKAAAKWLKTAQTSEKFNDYLAHYSIQWQFNLSRAPWWGGQFERLIGLFKNAFYKSIGKATLRWAELEDVVMDVEIALNNRPLDYVEDDVQLSVLTPNAMLHTNPNYLPELKAHHLQETNLRKRAKYLEKCKQAMWSRWTREYVRGLREQHRRVGGEQSRHPSIGDVVIIKDEQKNRNQWKLAIVTELIKGRDDVMRAAKLKSSKGVLERAIQHLFPLELQCDRKRVSLNPTVPEYTPRPKRNAAVAAELRNQEVAEEEQNEL